MHSLLAKLLLALSLALRATTSHGAILVDTFSFRHGESGVQFADEGFIPDANPSGWADSRLIETANHLIATLEVHLGISGGYNGDLYGYVSGPNGGHTVLFNRVGRTESNSRGYGDSGMQITFSAEASSDVHLYRAEAFTLNSDGQLTGAWQPDGHSTNPFEVTENSTRAATLDSFYNTDPNGEWTLFIADLSGGAESRILHWGVTLTTVPEPAGVALFSATLLGLFYLVTRRKARGR